MKKLSLITAICFAVFTAHAQTCTVTGGNPLNWSNNGAAVACAEGGNALGKTTLVIPFGMTVIFNDNTDTWTGTTIEIYGVLQIAANPVINSNVRVKNGGVLDLLGKLSLGTNTPSCNYSLIVESGGTVTVGPTAADRLAICGVDVMRGGGLGACNDCGGTFSGQCPYDGKPYCQPPGGFTGPTAYDESGYNPSLPVELLYFNAVGTNEVVSLAWATTMEENFSEFIIQRSADGMLYEDIGNVQGQGFNIYDIESKYSFVDEAPFLGTNYYRLKAVDLDNSHEFSEVKAVRMNGSKKLAVYPNPSNGESISFRLNFSAQESDRIYLIDQLGVEILNDLATSMENTIVFHQVLKPGVYMLRYVSRDFEQVTRVVVTH